MLKGRFLVKTERNFEKVFLSCLQEIPFLQVEEIERSPEKNGTRPDFLVRLKLPDREQILIAEVKSSGQPRLAREAAYQLLRYRGLWPGAYGVFMAPYISPRAAAVCEEEGVGYMDLAGNHLLSFGQVYIRKEGTPNPFAQKRDLRSLYAPRATRVLRVLLVQPGRKWKVQELADEAEVSLGHVFNVKKRLGDREWLGISKEGVSLREPEMLLKDWAANYTHRQNQVGDFYAFGTPGEVEAELAALCLREGIDYALTGFSGAARLAPAVRYQRVTAYIQEETVERIASQLELKRIESGANVNLLIPYDEGVFYDVQNIREERLVTPVQLYLDLQGFRGRGQEAAEALLKEVIRIRWQSGA